MRTRAALASAALVAVLGTGAATGAAQPSSAPVRNSGCHVHGLLPDHACTPGARFAGVTTAQVCTSGYSRRVRDVTYAEKSAVYAEYGLRRHFTGRNGEVDHLVPLELGGSNVEANLWPESAPGSHRKDRLENALHDEVCDGNLALSRAQRLIAGDWAKAYRARFG